MSKYISKGLIKLLSLVLIMVLIGTIAGLQIKNVKLQAQLIVAQESRVITGEYTLIHYPNSAWTNAIYVTEFYVDGQYIYFKQKDSTEFKPVWASTILPVDGWITGEKLYDYGYWEPGDDTEF